MKRNHLFVILFCFAVVLLSATLLFAQTTGETGLAFPTWFVTGVGLLIPLITQWIVKNLKTSSKKFWGSLVLQIICGIAGAFILGFSWTNLPELLAAIFALSQVSYRLWWKSLFESTKTGEALGLAPAFK